MRGDFNAMGTRISLDIQIEGESARRLFHQVRRWFLDWETIFSRFRKDSELSKLNQQPGKWVTVSAPLFSVICTSIKAARDTSGLVTPTVLVALEAAGYDRSYKSMNQPSNGNDLSAFQDSTANIYSLSMTAWQLIDLDTVTHQIFIPPGVRVDLGGFVKGWSADQAVLRLAETCPALVNAGGDIAISGDRMDGCPWRVAVPDLSKPGKNMLVLPFLVKEITTPIGIATSGTHQRRWLQNGILRHHIIDPRTARPVESDLELVTVIAPSALQAEIAAKMALISGSQNGLAWLEIRPWLSAILQYGQPQQPGMRLNNHSG
jgi:FAD:protein FMN transferase